jgi:hypothetical protein
MSYEVAALHIQRHDSAICTAITVFVDTEIAMEEDL